MLQSQEEGPYFYKQCLLRQKQSGGGRQIASGFLGSKGLHKRCFQKPFTLWKVQIGKKCKSEIIFTGELVTTVALTSLSESVLNLPGLFARLLPTLPLFVGIL